MSLVVLSLALLTAVMALPQLGPETPTLAELGEPPRAIGPRDYVADA
jgi:hypothetical protein